METKKSNKKIIALIVAIVVVIVAVCAVVYVKNNSITKFENVESSSPK